MQIQARCWIFEKKSPDGDNAKFERYTITPPFSKPIVVTKGKLSSVQTHYRNLLNLLQADHEHFGFAACTSRSSGLPTAHQLDLVHRQALHRGAPEVVLDQAWAVDANVLRVDYCRHKP